LLRADILKGDNHGKQPSETESQQGHARAQEREAPKRIREEGEKQEVGGGHRDVGVGSVEASKEAQVTAVQHPEVERDSLGKEALHVLEEARMVLPGIQALFGFQLIAVFNQRFAADLPSSQQVIHLIALLLTAISAALIMTPAAYHRQAERGQVSRYFIRLSSRLLTLAMAPLMAGICLDAFVVADLILGGALAAAVVAAGLFCLFSSLWFVFPSLRARRAPGK
jgi:hypothetical protein